MEKRKPTYDLRSFQDAAQAGDLTMTMTAIRTAQALGVDRAGIVSVIQAMERGHFYKSMTAYADSTAWQDAYHVPSTIGLVYIKFMAGRVTAFTLLSFKEKQNGY